MAEWEDRILHEGVDGIEEYDNSAPRWLIGLLYGAIVFAVLYLGWYALAFGDASYDAAWREEAVAGRAGIQSYFETHPLVPPTPEVLLAGAADPAVLDRGRARFVRTCAPCHGEQAQGLIGPNLTDDHWLHGGKVAEIFHTVVNGVPAKGMPPWGRALKPDELAAVVSYVRSLQGSHPAGGRPPEGDLVAAEPVPPAPR
jgi:cytochrome c oxidase cbb3-type subunit 3